MPRKAKEKKDELNNEVILKEKVAKVTKTKKTTSKTEKSNKTENGTKKAKKTPKEVTSSKTTIKKQKTDTKNKAETKATKTTPNTKTSKKAPKTASKSKTTKKTKSVPSITTEYYDLPFRYNETVVRILAQTPNILFIYWDISDSDKKAYIEKYGEDFWNNTRPYLVITNETMNYSFETQINDFANSWYLHISDANCKYKVELIRKFISDSDNENSGHAPYHANESLYITSSNNIEMPNNHILFDELGNSVFFRNVKTNITEERLISSISFLQNIGKIYNIYDLYKEIYKDELISDEFELNLSSSSSSTFK